MPGLVDKLVVVSDGDDNLQHTVAIPFSKNRSITHFAASSTPEGSDCLHLYWIDKSDAKDESYNRIVRELHLLPYELADADAVFQFVKGWLAAKGREYGPSESGDGTNVKGWQVEVTNDFYEVMTVTARWNYYGK
jgi:hypothetical protein